MIREEQQAIMQKGYAEAMRYMASAKDMLKNGFIERIKPESA